MKAARFWGVLGALSALISIIDFLIRFFRTMSFNFTRLQIIAIIIAITCFFLYLIMKNNYYRYKLSKIIHYPFNSRDQYIVKRKECIYTYISMEEMRYEKNHTIESTTNKLSLFPDQFKWSKHQDVNDIHISCKSAHKNLTIERQENWHVYKVEFDEIPKGTKKDITIEIKDLFDPNHEALPFLSSNITTQTDDLFLQVVFEKRTLCPVNICFQIFDNYAATFPCYEERVGEKCRFITYDHEKNVITVREKHPIYGHRYKIKWDFEPCV